MRSLSHTSFTVRERHYSPQLSRLVVRALYLEAKSRGKPMTRLADDLLRTALRGSAGMEIAEQTLAIAPNQVPLILKDPIEAKLS